MVWDVHTGERLCTLAGHKDYVRTALFSPDGTQPIQQRGFGTPIQVNGCVPLGVIRVGFLWPHSPLMEQKSESLEHQNRCIVANSRGSYKLGPPMGQKSLRRPLTRQQEFGTPIQVRGCIPLRVIHWGLKRPCSPPMDQLIQQREFGTPLQMNGCSSGHVLSRR